MKPLRKTMLEETPMSLVEHLRSSERWIWKHLEDSQGTSEVGVEDDGEEGATVDEAEVMVDITITMDMVEDMAMVAGSEAG